MEETIYEVYSFESDEWVECDKEEYYRTDDKHRRLSKKMDVLAENWYHTSEGLDKMDAFKAGYAAALKHNKPKGFHKQK